MQADDEFHSPGRDGEPDGAHVVPQPPSADGGQNYHGIPQQESDGNLLNEPWFLSDIPPLDKMVGIASGTYRHWSEPAIEAWALNRAIPFAEVRAGNINLFCKIGDSWIIGRAKHRPFYLQDYNGLHYIEILLRSPNKHIRVETLHAYMANPKSATIQIDDVDSIAQCHVLSKNVPTISGVARREYKIEMGKLMKERVEILKTPEQDKVRLSEIEDLIQALEKELKAGFKSRDASHPAEKMRKSVNKAVRYALSKIAKEDKVLGKQLKDSITLGDFAVYSPQILGNWLVF